MNVTDLEAGVKKTCPLLSASSETFKPCNKDGCAWWLDSFDQNGKVIPGKGNCAVNGLCINSGILAMSIQRMIMAAQTQALMKGKIINPNMN